MAEIGKLYTLAKDPGIAAYAMSDTYEVRYKNVTDWVVAESFERPFMVIEEYKRGTDYWVKILLDDKTGWLHVEEEQLRIFKPYR
jgi:pyruvate/2-oxoacid:ferredoxin oxidoreductase alpha subunit